MLEFIKKSLIELLLTLSNKTSLLSSKRIERAIFTGSSVLIVIGTWIHLMKVNTLTAGDSVMLISPILIAGGYNLSMGHKEEKVKKELNNEANSNNTPS